MNPILALISVFLATYFMSVIINYVWYVVCRFRNGDDGSGAFETAMQIFCPLVNFVVSTDLIVRYVQWTMDREIT